MLHMLEFTRAVRSTSNAGAKSEDTRSRFIEREVRQGGVEKLLLFRIEREVPYVDALRVACGGIPEDDPGHLGIKRVGKGRCFVCRQ